MRQTAMLHAAALAFLVACIAGPAPAMAQSAQANPPAVTLPQPEMGGVLVWPAVPNAIDTGPFGKWYVDGALSGLGLVQNAPMAGDRATYADLSNAQIFIQKIDGVFQFFLQAGFYSIPSIGAPYSPFDASHAIHNTYDAVPQAFIKFVPAANFYIEAGKLPTLIGPESTFTFENVNIERGLLWYQEPSVSRGVQAEYIAGPVTFDVSINDGYYSNRLNWVSGSATWTINGANSLIIDGGGNIGHTAYQVSTYTTPVAQNNGTMVNVAYTYKSTPWIVTPNVQYNVIPANQALGLPRTTSSYGAGVLVSYAFSDKFSLGGRAEYLATDGSRQDGSANLLYGPGSSGASLTVTPTYVIGEYYLRAEAAWVHAGNITRGDGFGAAGDRANQVRGLLEGGVLF